MVITKILRTLSDTEIMAIADQLANPNVNEQMVYKQLISKGNEGETLQEMYHEMNSDSYRGTLPRLVSVEISRRYRERLQGI
jgi:hypothetical protein